MGVDAEAGGTPTLHRNSSPGPDLSRIKCNPGARCGAGTTGTATASAACSSIPNDVVLQS